MAQRPVTPGRVGQVSNLPSANQPGRSETCPTCLEGLGGAMTSLETRKLDEAQLLANRGW